MVSFFWRSLDVFLKIFLAFLYHREVTRPNGGLIWNRMYHCYHRRLFVLVGLIDRVFSSLIVYSTAFTEICPDCPRTIPIAFWSRDVCQALVAARCIARDYPTIKKRRILFIVIAIDQIADFRERSWRDRAIKWSRYSLYFKGRDDRLLRFFPRGSGITLKSCSCKMVMPLRESPDFTIEQSFS